MKGGTINKNKMNKKGSALNVALVVMVILGALFLVAISTIGGTYNDLVQKDTDVEAQWGKVQSAYERRLDLIPNLVATVKGSAAFEKDTQTQIAELRGGVKNAKSPSDMQAVDGKMTALMSGINIQVEAYPDLKSTENFRALIDELAGTENRIKWERDNYNDIVKNYKVTVRSFPTNIIAGWFGFEESKWDTFEAEEGADSAPEVDFE